MCRLAPPLACDSLVITSDWCEKTRLTLPRLPTMSAASKATTSQRSKRARDLRNMARGKAAYHSDSDDDSDTEDIAPVPTATTETLERVAIAPPRAAAHLEMRGDRGESAARSRAAPRSDDQEVVGDRDRGDRDHQLVPLGNVARKLVARSAWRRVRKAWKEYSIR